MCTWACAHLRHAPRHVVHGQEHGRETGAYAAWAGARTLACGPWGHACASACGRMGMWPVAHWAMPQCGHHVGKRAHVDMCGHVVHGHGVRGVQCPMCTRAFRHSKDMRMHDVRAQPALATCRRWPPVVNGQVGESHAGEWPCHGMGNVCPNAKWSGCTVKHMSSCRHPWSRNPSSPSRHR